MRQYFLTTNYQLLATSSFSLTQSLTVFRVSPLESNSLRRNSFVSVKPKGGTPQSKLHLYIHMTTWRALTQVLDPLSGMRK